MPAVLTDVADLAAYPPFIRRVTAATVKAAVAVGNEVYDGTQYRIMRRALATQVLKHAENWGEVFAWGVSANPAVNPDATDNDVEFTVNSLWDAMAGAYTETSGGSNQATTQAA
ncbi:hypothetical protein [Labedaea rhizosphaerae]|uniref:Uncharacterized protein n=1 Tax=Labedaea rhizosphaerae TaxID=598644 RepID=A0A4R6SIM2_LABRH|nr:hypothetical protein [Labedaea rhizosphaerae]TDQ01236.1 hypothetical protein EV186_1021104 [Labedaea rhizosphaerae]